MIRATGVDSPDCIGTPTYRRHLRDESGIGRKKPLWWDLGHVGSDRKRCAAHPVQFRACAIPAYRSSDPERAEREPRM